MSSKPFYYNLAPEKILEQVQSSPQGISEAQAQHRLLHYGKNQLKGKAHKPAWLMFLGQFGDFMIIILMVAAIVSGLMGEITDTIIILIIVLLNSVIGFVQEYRAEKAIDALKQLSITTAKVIRDGKIQNIDSQDLVRGDIVQLEAGNAVAADLRLVEAHSLRIDESALTGESLPVDKNAQTLTANDLPLGDRLNMAYKGTLVTNGRALGVVVATGMQTELGHIARLLDQDEAETPLKKRMSVFSKNLTYIILAICAIIFMAGWLRGEDLLRTFMISISLAVAAIPEALPALMTIALAQGANRMARKNALVRKLPAVETLGSVSYICTDKTGTLTQNKMTVVESLSFDNQDNNLATSPLLLAMSLSHDVAVNAPKNLNGDSTEVAIVENAIHTLGFEQYQHLHTQYERIAELPFDSDRKRMSTIHRTEHGYIVLCKGAAEAIASTLSDTTQAQNLLQAADQWAKQGLRVLAFSYKKIKDLPEQTSIQSIENEFVLAGIVGIIDPPREEVKQAIAECKRAGIKTVMITGDHPATAAAIASQIGIFEENDLLLTGQQLAQLSASEFDKKVTQISVYARVSPEQKLQIVKTLQGKGHFVAMTGDGVNDAPSLKAANIGVAMGINGTDVSKEAAHVILLDDNFATIVKAVREGRRIYDNIRKFVKYVMTCNSAEIWTIFLAPLIGLPMPLLPIHILWINLVTDGLPGLALASEHAETNVMHRAPRPANEGLFAQGLGYHILWVGLFMAGVTLGTQAWSIQVAGSHWQTMVFTVLSLSQLGCALAVRSEHTFLYKQGIFGNIPLLASVLLTVVLQLTIIYIPFLNDVFKTSALTLNELLICFAAAAVIFHAVEFTKFIKPQKQ
ncbi:Ca2+-transporting ATPase [Flexibacter flexilis DSM 6793]|uniref:P-type Ca(2+) transporter n=1 Tax=Flexibacter flexilis DSM 6793 TaxID=927664 RepID=A0A1I1HWD1_9BACT|nr:calcium-translocating P-type ATPase, PMCA-type [Flexibacter flexilis]SFC28151.1 Ca2+-transporting ATPase [Flexibacter flexilis DSM 6793]